MKLNLLLLSAVAMVNGETAMSRVMTEPGTVEEMPLFVNLGTAGDYVILAKSGISTVPDSVITGDIAVSPIAATAITGFGLLLASDAQSSTATQVIGKAFAASYGGATATALTGAVGDMEIAYADAAGRANNDPDRINVGQGAIGGLTLTPGVYTFQMGVSIGADVIFDAGDRPDAVFIIQTTGALLQAANTELILQGGAQAKNIFWQVAGNVLVGVNSKLAGVLLVKTDVTFMTSSSLEGRILAQTACILQQATINGASTAPEGVIVMATATATVEVTATTTDLGGTETTKTTIITQKTEVTAAKTKRTTSTKHMTSGEETVIESDIVVLSAGSGAAAPAATAIATAVEGKAPFLATATSTASATASLSGSADATAEAESIAGPASTATSTATTTATRTSTKAEAFADATKTADSGTLPTAVTTTTGTTEAVAVALATKSATSTATATFTEA
jgi:hypothetical protein